jgi:hypothetical protein
MNWFKFFRLIGSSQSSSKKASRRKPQRKFPLGVRPALRVEELEDRAVPSSGPKVLSVSPTTGGTFVTQITVTFNENVTGAGAAGNFELFKADGTVVPIGPVSYNAQNFTTTIPSASLNGGAPLPAGTYSLFIKGDQISDAQGVLLAQPGQMVVANTSRSSGAATVQFNGPTLNAPSTFALPQGFNPSAIAVTDVNNDGNPDIVVTGIGLNEVAIFLGQPTGFDTTPDLTLALPAGAQPSALLVGDFDAGQDGEQDIAVVEKNLNEITVFSHSDTGFGYDTGTNYAVGVAPVGIVAGHFVSGSPFLDLAVVNSKPDTSGNYSVSILTGKGTIPFPGGQPATFAGAVGVTVGTTAPLNLTSPTSIAVGSFTNLGLDDLVVGGSDGISILPNGNQTTVSFKPVYVASQPIASVTTGRFTSGGITDVLATSATFGGQLLGFLNDGTGNFQPTATITAGVTNPTDLSFQFLGNVSGANDTYVGSAGGGALVTGPGVQAGLITGASATSPIVITSPNNNLVNGQQVKITGVQGLAGANGTFYVTNVNSQGFTLVNSAGTGTYTANTGTWIAVPGAITNVSGNGVGPIVITSPNNGLQTGQQVTIRGVLGNLAANGTFYITRLNANQFSLNGTTGNGTYTADTGFWSIAPYPVGNSPVGAAFGDFTGSGNIDAVTANAGSNDITFYFGSGAGTFLSSSTLQGTGAPSSIAVGDLNGDGIPDLVVADTSSSTVDVYLGLKQGGYAAPVSYSTVASGRGNRPSSVVLGDLANNGVLDIVVISNSDSAASVLMGNGDGTFRPATSTQVGQSPTQVVLADLNGDGVLDMVVSHDGAGAPNTRGVTVLLGNGNGTFATGTEIDAGVFASGVAVADFNGDGIPDIVVANDDPNGPGQVVLSLGNGDGTFHSGGAFTVGPQPTAITVADFNADGFPDVITVSGNDKTNENISVLLNNLGSGFLQARNTALPHAAALASVAVTNFGTATPYPDIVVGADKNGPNNVLLLQGLGDGTFLSGPFYTVDYTGESGAPTNVGVLSDPFQLLSTFQVVSKIVQVNLTQNGNFETRDLNGDQGNLDGWTTFDLKDPTGGSRGAWGVETLPTSANIIPANFNSTFALSPLSQTPVILPDGRYQAMLDESNLAPAGGFNATNNTPDTYSGSHALYQTLTIPSNATSVTLSMQLFLESAASWSDPSSNPSLDYRTGLANQQVRVDILTSTANILATGSNVLMNIFQTQVRDSTDQTIPLSGIDLSAFAGRTVIFRIAAANNQGLLIVGVDDVKFEAEFSDSTAPTLQTIHMRNPSFLAGPNTVAQSSDPTITGQVTDLGTPLNIKEVLFQFGTGNPNNGATGVFDTSGNFTFTPRNLLPGQYNANVTVINDAGIATTQVFTFTIQGPSLTSWASAGPGPIDVSATGLDFPTVSGKITGIAVDPRDPSGNTFYISAGNGGVWRTVDGGANWIALTDDITNSLNLRVPAPIGSITVANDGTVYAATGVDDISFTSRSGVGIIKSTNNGQTWTLLDPTDFTGARVSAIVADPNNTGTVYVAVSGWDGGTKQPAVFKTSNGGNTWANVLNPANMFTGGTNTLGAGAPLASVTALLVDPFNPNRVIIGLGNIGEAPTAGSAGVWLSTDGGTTWTLQLGGDNHAVQNDTIPHGAGVGRVTLAQGTGRVGDEKVVYALMATPTSANNESDNATELGLFKSNDNMLDWTKVMVRQNFPIPSQKENFLDLDLVGVEGGTVGAVTVDRTDPNVLYVGGSDRFTGGGPGLIRIDTGNMVDNNFVDPLTGLIPNTGDDINKFIAAEKAGNKYTDGVTYTGEGVFWYNIEFGTVNDVTTPNGDFLPGSVNNLVVDPQGRLLIGTAEGIYRGTSLGFAYDYTSGAFFGIINGKPPASPGMLITDINGNLQISDLTSVSIDPTNPNRLYISSAQTGSALTPGGLGAWQTDGLVGPNLAPINPDSFQVVAVAPAPGSPPDTPATVYRTWQFVQSNAVAPDVSTDGGLTFNGTSSAGISVNDSTGIAPVITADPTPINVNGTFFDELLFGTDKVYVTRTSGNVWDAISPTLSSITPAAGNVSALAIAPSNNSVYYAGTTGGRVFFSAPTLPPNTPFIDITGNLTNLLGGSFKINGVTVDPNNPTTAYVMVNTPNGKSSVYRTINAGATTGTTWASLSGSLTGFQLPLVASYSMAIDPAPSSGAVNGRIYLGNALGVYVSVDGGNSWSVLGQGLPEVPVVNLQFDPTAEVLAAATLGRGVFTVSTQRSGPAVLAASPPTVNETGTGLTQVQVAFNEPVDPRTFTAESDDSARIAVGLTVQNTTGYQTAVITALEQQYRRLTASSATIANDTQYLTSGPNGYLSLISFMVSSPYYYNNIANGTNAGWIEQVYQDLFGRTSAGDPQQATFLNVLNAAPASGAQAARLVIANQMIGINPSGFNNSLSREFQTRLAESLFDQYLGANAAIAFPASGAYATQINTAVQALQNRTPFANVLAGILSTTSAYQSAGTNYALPAGVHANSLTYGALSGAKDAFGNFIPDLLVAGSDNNLYIFQGRVGGGYAPTPTLTLALPAGANPSQITVGDFNNDGANDIAVANTGIQGAGSVSVFLNTRGAVGQISFGTRTDFNGGNNPVGIVSANLDGSGNLDLAVADQGLDALGNFDVTVLQNDGAGAFNTTSQFLLGNPGAANTANLLNSPTGIAVGHVTGGALPDIAVAGQNGVVVLQNGSSPGNPFFSLLLNRLTSTPTTSVAVGHLDSLTTDDVAATTDLVGGQVLIFQNNGGAFTTTAVHVGADPRSVHLADMNGDGKLDLVVANDFLGGGVSVLFNKTPASNAITFAAPITYPVSGSPASTIALGDTSQNGLTDVAVGYSQSQFVSLSLGEQQGVLQGATDPVYINWLYRALAQRTPTSTELTAAEVTLVTGYLVYMNGPDGVAAPLSVAPTDSTDLTYTITFAPRVLDGNYALWVGPNAQGVNLKDFVDQNGTFIGTGNAMNQNANLVNGENPGDRFRAQFAVSTSDTGRFITTLYKDFQGLSANNGRAPDNVGFITLNNTVQTAQFTAMTNMGMAFSGSQAATTLLVTNLYQQFGVTPSGTDISNAVTAIMAGQMTLRDLAVQILSGSTFFNQAPVNGDNGNWLNQVYLDLVGQPGSTFDPNFAARVAGLNNMTKSRATIAQVVVFSTPVLQQTIANYFLEFLGRAPVRNSDPALDETTSFHGVNLVSLLQQSAVAGKISPDQQLIAQLIATPEYIRVAGNSSFTWLASIYQKVLGQTVDTTTAPFTTKLNVLLTNFATARQTALTAVLSSLEYRNRVYTDYSNQFLGRPPTVAEFGNYEAAYGANGNRLEAAEATLLSSSTYFPLSGPSSSNATWLSNIYNALLGVGTSNNPTAANQLAFLNANSANQTQLASARFTVALQVLDSTAYRQILVTKFFMTYLNRSPNPTELNNWVTALATQNQETVLAQILMAPEFFLDVT